ncbi:endonuclease/exonuclease/phosphatase family protein [Sulfitobacter guttiformis]|uniref:Endonuclease/exonuclease/phosphatase family metal-dependent hydrolase n=1 Tax=Sulfitobacter guttiformis TaxID=74349 RepID=A0A420DJ76_9RHOB|nr:endonuclease/exonuclease/phosphatase family protein [Sulfitobacter guttiformis]KIN71921.1 Endonuclease/exonuclease/phosphatase family [Sulfitobacter guttiformis KCTC 32187]RKE94271.1 endonuclease/exonuclease/phosphatase family metal-dependent hydrolase [Sulfitobacter guttiformis]
MLNDQFTFASYNIRKAIGRDGKRNPQRIVEVLNALSADIVILQEGDLRFKGRRAIFSSADLFDQTGLTVIDVAPQDPGLGWHGNMLLVRAGVEVNSVEPITLPGLEPRGAVVSRLSLGHRKLDLIQSHLGLVPAQRKRQAQLLAGCVNPACPTVLAGDLNAAGSAPPSLSPLHAHLDEVVCGPTFPTRWPMIRFDRIFHTRGLKLLDAQVYSTALARQASDHLPVSATFTFL